MSRLAFASSSFCSCVAVLASTAVAARAQGPVAAPEVSAHACCLWVDDGRLRADGAHFTAVFGADGVTYTPALGRRAPRRYPVRLRTASIGRDATASPAAIAAVTPTAVDDRVIYARASATESWRITPEGLELSYAFAHRMPGAGDLIVHLRMDTDLLASPTAAGGLLLRAGEFGGVRIGAVQGIDAAGKKVAGSVRVRADGLELRLPAAFVDAAAYPLLLDPLIGAEIGVATGADDAAPDVAFDAGSQTWLVVWQRDIAIDQVDLLGRRLDVNGRPVGSLLVIRSLAVGLARKPSVVSVRMRSRFVVAWREAPDVVSADRILCRCVDPDGTISGVANAPGVSVITATGPVLSGNATTTDDGVLLAWPGEGSIVAARVMVPATGGPVFGGVTTLASGGALYALRTARSCGASGRFVLLWDYFALGSYRVAQALSLQVAPVGARLSMSNVFSAPALDGDGTNFMVASTRASDVWCQRMWWNGLTLVMVGSPEQVTNDAEVQSEPSIAFTGRKYVAVWSQNGGVPFANDVLGIALDPGTCTPCGRPFSLRRPGYDYEPVVAAQAAAGAGTEAMICFSSAATTLPFASEVIGQRFATFSSGTLQNVRGGCGAALTMTTNGPIAIGNRGLTALLNGVSGAAAGFLNLNATATAAFPCGTCSIMLPGLLASARLTGSVATVDLELPCDPNLIDAALDAQWLVLGSTTPCPLLSGFAFSDRYRLTIAD